MAILQLWEVPVVRVPAAVAGVFDRFDVRAPIHLHEADTGLDEPPCDQAALAEAEPTVPPAQRVGLARNTINVEHRARLARSQQRKGLPIVTIEVGRGGRFVD